MSLFPGDGKPVRIMLLLDVTGRRFQHHYYVHALVRFVILNITVKIKVLVDVCGRLSASVIDLNNAIRLLTVNSFLLSVSLINALLNSKINNISNLALLKFCRSALLMCLQTENTCSCRPLELSASKCHITMRSVRR